MNVGVLSVLTGCQLLEHEEEQDDEKPPTVRRSLHDRDDTELRVLLFESNLSFNLIEFAAIEWEFLVLFAFVGLRAV